MKENSLEPKKLPGDRALMVTEDWEKYVTDLLQRMERVPPEVPEYDFKGNYDANREIQKTYNERAIFHMRFGKTLIFYIRTFFNNNLITFFMIFQATVWTNWKVTKKSKN